MQIMKIKIILEIGKINIVIHIIGVPHVEQTIICMYIINTEKENNN